MRLCTFCETEKKFTDFSPQKTNPKKLYAWCDPCRKENNKPKAKRYDLRSEYATMRAKAKQLRKFDDAQAAELRRLYESDKVPLKVLAEQFSSSPETIRNTINRSRKEGIK